MTDSAINTAHDDDDPDGLRGGAWPVGGAAWQPFPAPDLDRVLVCGWQPRTASCAGYWWYHEDATDDAGYPTEYPGARYWTPFVLPKFPTPPVGAA